jgi:hypothetical protein
MYFFPIQGGTDDFCSFQARQMWQNADKKPTCITRFPTVDFYELRGVVLDVGRDVDNVLFRDPLSVFDQELVGNGVDGIGGVVSAAVDVDKALNVVASFLEAAPHNVVAGPGAGARELGGQ